MDLKYYYEYRLFNEMVAMTFVKDMIPRMTERNGGLGVSFKKCGDIEKYERIALVMEAMFWSSGIMSNVVVEPLTDEEFIIKVDYKKMTKKEKQEHLLPPRR